MTWLSPGEASKLAGVTPKTLTRWAAQGLVSVERTGGGQRRYDRESLLAAKGRDRDVRAAVAAGAAVEDLTPGAPAPKARAAVASETTDATRDRSADSSAAFTRALEGARRGAARGRKRLASTESQAADPFLRDYDGNLVRDAAGKPITFAMLEHSIAAHFSDEEWERHIWEDPEMPTSRAPGTMQNPHPPIDCERCNPRGLWPDPRFARDRAIREADALAAILHVAKVRADISAEEARERATSPAAERERKAAKAAKDEREADRAAKEERAAQLARAEAQIAHAAKERKREERELLETVIKATSPR